MVLCNVDTCTEPAYWKTSLPTFNFSMDLPVYVEGNFEIYHLYKQDPHSTDDIMGILLIANQFTDPVTLEGTITGADYYDISPLNVGPHPLWKEWFDPQFVASPVYKIFSDKWDVPTFDNVTINILLRKQMRNAQNPLCVGVVSPWYWHEADNSTDSPLAALPIFQQYRDSFNVPNSTLPQTPKYRWRCTTLQEQFVFIQDPPYLSSLGLAGGKIDTWGTYALIENPALTPANTDIPLPVAPQIPVIIAGAAIFLIFLLAMIISHATDENSPSLKCWKK